MSYQIETEQERRSAQHRQWALIAAVAGLIAFVVSFLPYYTAQRPSDGSESTATAWFGFFGWAAALVALVAAVVLFLMISRPAAKRHVAAIIGVVLFVVALLCVLIAGFDIPGRDEAKYGKVDLGHSWGFWLSLIAIIVGLIAAILAFITARRPRPTTRVNDARGTTPVAPVQREKVKVAPPAAPVTRVEPVAPVAPVTRVEEVVPAPPVAPVSTTTTTDATGPVKGTITASGDRIYHTTQSSWYHGVHLDTARGERYFSSESEAIEAGFRKARPTDYVEMRNPIKGNISSSGEKIYHVPSGRFYDRTFIDTATGERYFATEADAIAAGFRRSRR